METLKARVQNGKIVGKAPPGLADGTELEVRLAEPGEDMSPQDLKRLQQALAAGWSSMEKGNFRPAADVLADLRARR